MTSLGCWCALWTLVFCGVYSAPVVQDGRDAVARLVERFAPLLYLHPEERWLPDDVDTFLDNVRVRVGRDKIVPLDEGALPVGPHTEDHHIIAELPRGVGTTDVEHQPFLAGTGPEDVPVYVKVTHCDPLSTNQVEASSAVPPSFLATYWTFHPFNEGKWAFGQLRGNHVGDWEHVSIRVQEGELKEIFVSAHEFGAYYIYCPESDTFNFTTAKGPIFSSQLPPYLELDGTHPVLYVALGSHGLWSTPGNHLYSPPLLPPLVDVTAAGGPVWSSWRRLVSLNRAPPAWLQYDGRWGNPSDCILKASCGLASGPWGLRDREPDFECGVPTPRPFWRRLFGRRRRRRRDVARMVAFS